MSRRSVYLSAVKDFVMMVALPSPWNISEMRSLLSRMPLSACETSSTKGDPKILHAGSIVRWSTSLFSEIAAEFHSWNVGIIVPKYFQMEAGMEFSVQTSISRTANHPGNAMFCKSSILS